MAQNDNDAGGVSFLSRVDWAAFWTALVVSFIVYFYTLAPSVTLEDGGELAVAGDWLGVPHPPGYPSWTMLAWVFARIFSFVTFRGQPNPSYGIAMLSAVSGAIASGLAAMLICRSGRDILRRSGRISHEMSVRVEQAICWAGGVAASLLFAFTPIMWSQSVIVEVYSLNALFLILVLLLVYKWMTRPSDGTLFLVALIFGIGLTNYQVLLLAMLALAILIMLRDFELFRDFAVAGGPIVLVLLLMRAEVLPTIKHPTDMSMYVYLYLNGAWLILAYFLLPRGKTAAITILLAELGVSVYAYMPIVSDLRNPPMNWAYPRTWEGFQHAISRGQYEKIVPVDVFSIRFLHQIGTYLADLRLNFTMFIALVAFLPFSTWRLKIAKREVDGMKWATILILLALLLLSFDSLALVDRIDLYKVPALGVFLILLLGAVTMTVARFRGLIHDYLLADNARLWERITAAGVLGVTSLIWLALVGKKFFAVVQDGSGSVGATVVSLMMIPVLLAAPFVILGIGAYLLADKVRDWQRFAVAGIPGLGAVASLVLMVKNLVVVTAPLRADMALTEGQREAISQQCESILIMTVIALLVFGLMTYMLFKKEQLQLTVDENSQKWMVSTLIAFVTLSVGLIALANLKMDIQDTFIQRVKFISSHLLFSFWIGYGLIFLLAFLDGRARSLTPAWIFAVALLPVIPILSNAYNPKLIKLYGGAEQHDRDFGWQFGNYQLRGAEAILEELDPDEEPLPNPVYPPEMGDDAIFFGGTDPGRFVPTYMIYSADVRPDVYLITQNALADGTYMSVMRDLYGNDIWIPSVADSANAFTIYVNEVDSGKRRPNAGITRKGGRVQISGVMGVMEINGILAKQIFDYNNWKHAFYVEESYVIAWMYPYLAPHGLIMKINRERLSGLPPENVQDDLDFWDWYTRRFVENGWFVRDVVARKSFSKLRSAIAGLYGYRGMQKEAIQAFNEALKLYPLSPEANFRLAEVYMRTGQFDKARDLMKSFGNMDPANEKVDGFLRKIDSIKALNAEIQELEGELQTDKQPSAQKVLRLASLYLQGGRVNRFIQVAGGLLQSPQMPSALLLPLAQLYDKANRPKEMARALTLCLERMPPQAPPKQLLSIAQLFGKRQNAVGMRKALKAYLERQPNDWRAWLQVATLDVQAKDQEQAAASLGMAVRYGGADAQRAIKQNQALAPIWQQRAQRTQGLLGF